MGDQRDALVATHERYVQELTDDFEQKLEEDRHLHQQLEEEKVMAEKEYAEMQQQLEDDIDTEIENLRDRYDTQLNHERELTLRYKGENGIMKKRFTVLQQNIEDNKEFIKGCIEKEEELKQQIKALETEIKQHKREIKGRDETIGGKEKKIYDLKKKNQELEKFKFVLDYKIKELKRQIEPRETEISTMKNQIKDMDRELEQYHKSNAQLDLMIGDAESAVMQFKGEIHDCVQFIQDPTLLSDAVRKMSVQYRISSKETSGTLDSNIAHEYHRHKDYLERTFQTMKEKFTQDIQTHQAANARIMRDNMNLIRDINKQREANRTTKQHLQARQAAMQRDDLKRQKIKESGIGCFSKGAGELNANEMKDRLGYAVNREDTNLSTIIDVNRERIAPLRESLSFLQDRLRAHTGIDRSAPRDLLPPVAR